MNYPVTVSIPKEVLAVFETVPDLYLILSPELVILTASNKYLKVTGTRREAVTGRHLSEVFPDDTSSQESVNGKQLYASLRQVLGTRKPHKMPRQLYQAACPEQEGGGTRKYWQPLNTPVLNEGGEVQYIIHKLEDVTGQVNTSLILDNINEAFVQLDHEYRYVYVNETTESILKKKKEDLIGKILWEVFPELVGTPAFHAIVKANIERVKVETESFSPVTRRWVLLTVAPSENGVILFFYNRQDVKEAQLKSNETETLLREEEMMAHTGSYEADIATWTFRFSDGMYLLFGEEPQSFVPTPGFIDSRTHPEDRAVIMHIKTQAAADKKPYAYTRRIYRKDGALRILEVQGKVVSDEAGQTVKFLGLAQDVTERKRAEKEVLEKNALLVAAIDVSPVALFILGAVRDEHHEITDFCFNWLSKSGGQLMGENLQGQPFTKQFPYLLQINVFGRFVNTVETGEPTDSKFLHHAEGGERWMRWRAVKLNDGLFVSVEDITDLVNAAQLKERIKGVEQAYNLLMQAPVAIAIFKGKENIIELANAESLKLWGRSADVVGKPLLDVYPEIKGQGIVKLFDEVRNTGKPYLATEVPVNIFRAGRQETRYNNVIYQPYYENGGDAATGVFALSHEVTELVEVRLKVEESEAKYRTLFSSIDEGFCIIEKVGGNPLNFRYTAANLKMSQVTGISEIVGQTIRDLFPDEPEECYEILDNALITGIPHRYERELLTSDLVLDVHVVRIEDGTKARLGVVLNDITERKRAQEQLQAFNARLEQQVAERTHALQEQAHFISRVMDVVPDRISVTDLASGKELYINRDLLEEHGFDKETLLEMTLDERIELLQMHPDDLANLADFYQQVAYLEDGQIATFLYRANFGTGKWRYFQWRGSVFERNASGQATATLNVVQDITTQKEAEAEIEKNLTLLRQSEEIAQMGSWERDIVTGIYTWSEGMYRLFGLPVGSPVNLLTYLNQVIDEDRPLVINEVTYQLNSYATIEETLRIRVNDKVQTLKMKSMMLRNEHGKPVKLLGVVLDVSEVKRLEAESLQMQLKQQKALLLAILNAQEEERWRISEALHNGVGQLLCATKLNLAQVARLVPEEEIRITEKLLDDAINETRRVSHELVPVVLKEFGLNEAIQEMCSKYGPNTICITCDVDVEEQLEPFVELALYRICQELLNNVIRHAKASEINILLHDEEGEIILKVRDNGKGMTPEAVKLGGLGLRTMQDRVKLLNGTFAITQPHSGKGTQVAIRIPVMG